MKLTLKLFNVGVLGPGTVEIDFEQGVNAIVGDNGRGKSTIVNALYFAVTGETLDNSLLEDLINWDCSQMSVTLIYNDIVIERSMTKKGTSKASFTKASGEPIVRKKEITAAVCELFGLLSVSVFKLVYFAEQFKSNDIIQESDAFRLSVMSTIAGLSELESVRNHLLDASNSIDVFEIPNDMMDAARNSLKEATDDLSRWNSEYAKLSNQVLSQELKLKFENILNSPDAGTIDNYQKLLDEAKHDLESARQEESELPKPPTQEETNLYKQVMSKRACDEQRNNLNIQLKELGDPPPFEAVTLRSYLDDIASKIGAATAERRALIERPLLIKEGKCPITKGPPCPDLEAMTNQATISSDIALIDANIEKFKADREEINKLLDSVNNYNSKCSFIKAALAKLPEDLDVCDFDVSAYEKRVEDLRAISDRRAFLNKFIGEKLSLVSELESKLSSLNGVVEYSKEDKDEASTALRLNIEATAKLDAVRQSILDAEKRVASSTDTINLYDIQNKTASVNKDKKYVLDKVRFALHRDNVPRLLIEKMLAKLNVVMESYLNKFNFPYIVKFSNTGKLLYYTSDGECHETKKLSGGQQYVVVIAFRCALADILNSQFPLFVFDEPTTGLDVQNRDALSDVLVSLGESKNKIVIIPTHDDKLLPESKIFSV